MLSIILCPLSASGACIAAPQYHVINILVSMQGKGVDGLASEPIRHLFDNFWSIL